MTRITVDSHGRHYVRFKCPRCGRPLKSPIERIEKKVRCRECDLTFPVPGKEELEQMKKGSDQEWGEGEVDPIEITDRCVDLTEKQLLEQAYEAPGGAYEEHEGPSKPRSGWLVPVGLILIGIILNMMYCADSPSRVNYSSLVDGVMLPLMATLPGMMISWLIFAPIFYAMFAVNEAIRRRRNKPYSMHRPIYEGLEGLYSTAAAIGVSALLRIM